MTVSGALYGYHFEGNIPSPLRLSQDDISLQDNLVISHLSQGRRNAVGCYDLSLALAAHPDYGLVKIRTFTRNVCCDHVATAQPHPRNLSLSRIGLLGFCDTHT